ncbi:hypothetical protein KTT_11310 [Tengunoibacter tsumagoiensis]|uniref:Guanylate cyclase domain-containing protein n=2 Tax=Tengunoibacter tsumagoiensis TaxID=2014871 RepID=A0A401ZWT4_9CHLR|nr:hypothetical protein KTT_11310 [Tengunoibacter tsumagoiensis]
MFADITGSTPLADRLDPEEMRSLLTSYFNLMAEQIRKHGGTIEKYIGDAIMAVFGAPIAHEDDPDRAIRAALDMQTALTNFNQQRLLYDTENAQLQMRIGINTGEVAAPNNAGRQRQDFLITGDAVNIAARLQQVATPDTILVGERTYLSARQLFAFRAISPLQLKGKPEPIAAHVVIGLQQQSSIILQPPRGIGGRSVPLIGRTLELTLLHANYARVLAEHHPHLITILGAPGIGKSRMVQEFITREKKLAQRKTNQEEHIPPLVLKGRCPPYGEGITYWPFIEIVRTLINVQTSDNNEMIQQRFLTFVNETLSRARSTESAEEIASAILPQIDRDPTPKDFGSESLKPERQGLSTPTSPLKQGGTQGTLLRAWRVLLEALGEQQPLIIVLDDLQWADEAFLDLLEYLTDRITATPVLFLCPARPEFLEHRRDWGGGHRNFTAIELETLTWQESSDLVDALLNPNDLPETLRYTILTRAEGNPFFVEEIVRMFIDQGILVREQSDEHETPTWRIGYRNDVLLGELSTPGEPPEDALIEQHYLLPLSHVPDTIQGVLAARVDLLDPTEKLILQHAAIIGRTFWLSSLLEMASDLYPELVMEALVSLLKRDFVTEIGKQRNSPDENDRTFNFKHILIRDVVYNTIPRQRRTREHAHLALWLEGKTQTRQEAFIELLAYHYQQALASWSANLALEWLDIGNLPLHHLTRKELRQRTLHFLILTGDQALHNYYTLRALKAYNDALELLVEEQADAPSRSSMHEKLGDAYSQRGNLDEAWQHYRQALQLLNAQGTSEDTASLLFLYERLALLATRWLARFDIQPDVQETWTYIDAGLQLLEGQPISRESIAFLTYRAFWYIRQLETAPTERKQELAEQAFESGKAALRLAEELDNPRTLSLTLDAMGFIYDEYHKYREALELQQRRLKLEGLLTDREELYDLYFSLGAAYEKVADYPSALMWYGRAWSDAQTMESPSMLLTSIVGRMRAWRQWNRWENAHQVALEILQLIEKYQQDEKRQLWALETLSVIAYHQGKLEEGDQYARQYKRLIDQQSTRSGVDEKTRFHAIHLARGDYERALLDYKEKISHSEPYPQPETLATLAELVVRTPEQGEEQLQICQRAIQVGEQSGARKSLAVALRARGNLWLQRHDWTAAEEDLRRALQLCEELDLPWERGHTLYALALLYQQRASELTTTDQKEAHSYASRARYHLEQAHGFYKSLGATPAAAQVEVALKQERQSPSPAEDRVDSKEVSH